jgi:hypothetical protein
VGGNAADEIVNEGTKRNFGPLKIVSPKYMNILK